MGSTRIDRPANAARQRTRAVVIITGGPSTSDQERTVTALGRRGPGVSRGVGPARKKVSPAVRESPLQRIQRNVGNSALTRLLDQGVLRDPGEALDPGVRRLMESRLGFDF